MLAIGGRNSATGDYVCMWSDVTCVGLALQPLPSSLRLLHNRSNVEGILGLTCETIIIQGALHVCGYVIYIVRQVLQLHVMHCMVSAQQAHLSECEGQKPFSVCDHLRWLLILDNDNFSKTSNQFQLAQVMQRIRSNLNQRIATEVRLQCSASIMIINYKRAHTFATCQVKS